jgi:hypothetical protein
MQLPKNYDSWRLASPYDDEKDDDEIEYIAQEFHKYQAIQKVLENCDYDLTEFFVKTDELWQVFDEVEFHNAITNESQDYAIDELYTYLNDHIKFRSNYTLTIDDFQGR